MDNKKRDINDISIRLDYLADMASIADTDLEALSIELDDINKKIEDKDKEIEMFTPSSADYDRVKGFYQNSLDTAKNEITEFEKKLTEIDKTLEENQAYVEELSNIESNLTIKKERLTSYLINLNNTARGRQLNSYIDQTDSNIKEIEKELAEINTKKTRKINSIKVYEDKKEDLNRKIQECQEEINRYELLLSSSKYLNEHTLIKDKEKIMQTKIEEKNNLVARKNEIEHSPIYIANKIKEKINNQDNLDEILELIEELSTLALSKPYMAKVIRNGNSEKLNEEYNKLKKAQNKLLKKVKESSYSLDVLPSEDARIKDLQAIIDSKNQQRKTLEKALEANEELKTTLLANHINLQDAHKQTLNSIDDYFKGMDELVDSKELANMKLKQKKMQKVADIEEELVDRYPENISSIIRLSDNYNQQIKEIDNQIKEYEKEKKAIEVSQKEHKGYTDVIAKSLDEYKFETINNNITWLEKRLKYCNYNVKQLVNEIKQTVKRLYPKPKVEIKQQEETIKPKEIDLESITSLDIPDQEISQKDVKDSIDSLNGYLDVAQQIQGENNDKGINLDLDLRELEENYEEKEEHNPFENILNTLDNVENSKKPDEEIVRPKSPLDDLLKPLDSVELTNPLEEKKKEKKDAKITIEDLIAPLEPKKDKSLISEPNIGVQPQLEIEPPKSELINEGVTINTDKMESIEQPSGEQQIPITDEKVKVTSVEPQLKIGAPTEQAPEDTEIKVINIEPLIKEEKETSIETKNDEQQLPVPDEKMKVISVEPLQKSVEAPNEQAPEDAKIKVISAEPLFVETKGEITEQNNNDVFNGFVFEPFAKELKIDGDIRAKKIA